MPSFDQLVTDRYVGAGFPVSTLTEHDAILLGIPNPTHGKLPDTPEQIFSNPEIQSMLSANVVEAIKIAASEGHIGTLPSGGSLASLEPSRLRLAHLDNFNHEIAVHSLAPQVTLDQFRASFIDGVPMALGIKEVTPIGGGFYQVEIPVGLAMSENLRIGTYRVIMRSENLYQEQGANLFCLTSEHISSTSELARGRVNFSGEIHYEFHQQLSLLEDSSGRPVNIMPFPESKLEGAPLVVSAAAVGQHNDFFARIVLTDENGVEQVFFSNNRKDGTHGSVNRITFPDGSNGLIAISRPIQRRSIRTEASRGYPKGTEQRLSELEAETGLSLDLVSDQDETLWQGQNDHNYPYINKVNLDQFIGMSVPGAVQGVEVVTVNDGRVQTLSEEFESITPVIFNTPDLVMKILRGDIDCAFTLATYFPHLLETGQLEINPAYLGRGMGVILEQKYFPQLGKYMLVMPTGHRDLGTHWANVIPNSGMLIGDQRVNMVNKNDLDRSFGSYISLPLEKLTKFITTPGSTDMVTKASLCLAAKNAGIYVEPDLIDKTTSYR